MPRKPRQTLAPVLGPKARQKARSVPAKGHRAGQRPTVERLDVHEHGPTMRYLVGVDPGGRTSGVTMLRVDGDRPAWGWGQMLEELCQIDHYDVHLVAVECPGVVYAGMGQATSVLMTAFTAASWYEHSQVIYPRPHRAVLTPQSVRIALCGKAGASDADVKAALAAHVDGIPTRTNTHVRDAAAVALVGWWRVRAELDRLRALKA